MCGSSAPLHHAAQQQIFLHGTIRDMNNTDTTTGAVISVLSSTRSAFGELLVLEETPRESGSEKSEKHGAHVAGQLLGVFRHRSRAHERPIQPQDRPPRRRGKATSATGVATPHKNGLHTQTMRADRRHHQWRHAQKRTARHCEEGSQKKANCKSGLREKRQAGCRSMFFIYSALLLPYLAFAFLGQLGLGVWPWAWPWACPPSPPSPTPPNASSVRTTGSSGGERIDYARHS